MKTLNDLTWQSILLILGVSACLTILMLKGVVQPQLVLPAVIAWLFPSPLSQKVDASKDSPVKGE